MVLSFNTIFLVTSLMLVMVANIGESGSVGINFGRQASQKLLPSMVVDMCLANGISKVKFFSVNEGVMSAFSRSNIDVILAIPNIELPMLTRKSNNIENWMNRYIIKYLDEEVNIRHLCVGVEPFAKIERKGEDTSYIDSIAPVMEKIENIIESDQNRLRGNLKLGVPISMAALKRVSKPSQGDFRIDYKDTILRILNVLNRTDSPFMINIYPYLSVTRYLRPLEFGMFDNRSSYTVTDGNLVYTNEFDFEFDTLVWALRKNGYGNIKIMVSQVGWPTDGGLGANVKMAKRFYDGLLKKVASNQGTPLLPGVDLDVYLYELADENWRRIDRGPFERHYGIYNSDGRAKFNLDFTLSGRDMEPEPARGITYLPQRWCILNENSSNYINDKEIVDYSYNEACKKSDCTALEDGGSCTFLEYNWKVSYAFNMYFQMSNQELVSGDAACDFNGLGRVTDEKPSFGECDFPVQILSTLFLNGRSDGEMIATLGKDITATGERRRPLAYHIVIMPLLWILFLQIDVR